jgi:hypothetical protein
MRKSNFRNFKSSWTLLFMILVFGLSAKADVHPIPSAPSDSLEHFIENIAYWNSGDTIMLSESSTYIVGGTIDLFQEVTVMGDPSLDVWPEVRFYDNGFRPKEDTISITLKNMRLNGLKEDNVGRAGYFLRFDQIAYANWNNIVIENIEAYNFLGGIQFSKENWCAYENVVINNILIHDLSGTSARVFELRHGAMKNMTVTNSTFYNCYGALVTNPYFSDGTRDTIQQNILFERNTFFRMSNGSERFIQINDPQDSSITFTFRNNIVSTLLDTANARPFDMDVSAGEFYISNSVFHFFESSRSGGIYNLDSVAKNQTNVFISDISQDYPEFADSAARNFALPDYSPLITTGSDGKMIGDPRWKPTNTLHRIPNTSADTLEHFIENTDRWNSGDTIMLVDASQYIVKGTIDIFQDVTIMGDPELIGMPELRFDDNGFRPKVEHVSVAISDLNLNGYNADSTHRAGFILRYQLGMGAIFKNITIRDCNAWGFGGGIDLNQGKHAFYDTILVDNVIWHDFLGDYCIDPNINFAKYVKVTNSTFYDIGTGFIKNPSYAHADNNDTIVPKRFIIDQNTFYKVAGNNNSLIQVNDPKDQTVNLTFTNNIVVDLFHPNNARPFRIDTLAGVFTIKNSVFNNYDVTDPTKMQYNLDTVMLQNNVYVSAIYENYPEFADSAARNFTLPDESPLLEAGVTGIAIGDPRWWPEGYNPGADVHRIPSVPADSLEHFIENISYWDPGDIIMLIDDATYIVSGTIDIFQEVTIVGDPSLSDRPEVRFYDNGFRLKEDSINLTIKNLRLNGLKEDDVARANYFLRFDQIAYQNWKTIKIQNIDAYNFVGGIQLSKDNWCAYDSVVIDNVTIHDFTGRTIEPRHGALKYMSVTNSTFYDIKGALITNPYFSDGSRDTIAQNIIFDRNTFFKMSNGSERFIQINDPQDSSITFTFTNNIVSTLLDTTNARPFDLDVSGGEFYFANCVFHDFISAKSGYIYNLDSVSINQSNVYATNIDDAYPAFIDSSIRYFMLPDNSPLLTFATDGGAIGDPEWVPQIGIKIRPVTGRILKGDEVQLIVDVVLSEGSDTTVTWTVENNYGGTTGTATIDDASGLMTAGDGGQVKVKATSNLVSALSDSVILTIEELVLVTDINLSSFRDGGATSTSITARGDSLNVRATVNPEDADDKTLIWSVSGDGDATIKELNANTIRIIAVSDGNITVTATAQDGSGVSGTHDISISGQTVGLNETMAQEIGIVPNPAKNVIRISVPERSEVAIHNVLGNVMITKWVDVDDELNIQHLEAGLYFVIIRSGDYYKTVRLIKE